VVRTCVPILIIFSCKINNPHQTRTAVSKDAPPMFGAPESSTMPVAKMDENKMAPQSALSSTFAIFQVYFL